MEIFRRRFNKESEKFISRRMVAKIGSSTITGGHESLDIPFIENISRQAAKLFNSGVDVLILSSGAVASGKKDLGRLITVLDKQVAALFGQPEVISEWRKALNRYGIKKVGQLLIAEPDLKNIKSSLLNKALYYGVVVANGNDPANKYEIKKLLKSADNDKLGGLLARKIGADTLLLLTDTNGVLNKNGETIDTFRPGEEIVIFPSSKSTNTGDILSKIKTAQEFHGRAIVANGRTENILLRVARGEKVGTQFNFDER